MPLLVRRSLVCVAIVAALILSPDREGRALGQEPVGSETASSAEASAVRQDAAALAPARLDAVDLSPPRLDAVERFVSRYRAPLGLPGVAVAVATPTP